jgi:hypothetical protein
MNGLGGLFCVYTFWLCLLCYGGVGWLALQAGCFYSTSQSWAGCVGVPLGLFIACLLIEHHKE